MRQLFLMFILILLLVMSAQAATLHGTVYDLYLNEQGNVKVEINTVPRQIYVSKDGDYSFDVPEGDYCLKAKFSESGVLKAEVEESVNVGTDGDYVIDLILFPVLDDTGVGDQVVVEKDNSLYALLALVVVIVLLSVLIWYAYNKFKKLIDVEPIVETLDQSTSEHKDDITLNVLNFIKKNQGRVTQKQIRKEFLSSEAKISLVLTELEQNGLVEKIKKGRGNIIILK